MRNKKKFGKYRYIQTSLGNSDKYSRYRLKMWRQRLVDLRLRNTDTQIEEWAIDA
jgi:hypothetical protein